jgi:ubiquinone/menaquinone biosynthesis C-methylase UbiE
MDHIRCWQDFARGGIAYLNNEMSEVSIEATVSQDKELKDISTYFDNDGKIWIRAYDDNPDAWNQYSHLKFRQRHACDMIRSEGKGTVVDVGCGSGHALLRMKEMGFQRLIGVDISDKMLDFARKLVEANNLSDAITIHKGDVCNLDWIEPNSVDVVTALGVIEYLRDDEAFLAEMHRILKPGGAAVIQSRNGDWIHARLRRLVGRVPNPKIWCQEHTAAALRTTAERVGLQVDAEKFCHYYALYPFDLMPGIGRLIRPIDFLLSRNLERCSSRRPSRWFSSMYIARFRKPATGTTTSSASWRVACMSL